MRKPRGKASRESHRSLDPHDGKRDPAATAREESTRACPHLRGGLTLQGRLQKSPNIHVSTAEETSGSGPEPHKLFGPGINMDKKHEKKEEGKENGHYLRREFSYTKFQQTMLLPDDVDKEKITATVENGVLKVEIPKYEKKEVPATNKMIEIK